jgi:FdhD protein
VRAVLEVEITRIDLSKGEKKRTKDLAAEEKPLHVFLNRVQYATILCTPSNLKELTVGHLFSEGIIRSIKEIKDVILKKGEEVCRVSLKDGIDLEKRLKLLKHTSRVIFSACGSTGPYQSSLRLPKIESNLKVKAVTLLNSVNQLNSIAETYRKTGGVHVAAIFKSDGSLVAFAEDVGRHNAVDKTIGIGALSKIDFEQCFLALSGRLTGDIVTKAARAKLSVLGSLAAAIDSGIAIAKSVDLTLVGFVRGKRMNIYCSPERIVI